MMAIADPRFCCAILTDSRGYYILERRPLHETDAPGKLTFFGGGRLDGEDPLACLRRELLEELGFTPGPLERVFTLRTPRGQAWFYTARGPEEGAATAREPGYRAVWISPDELLASPLAPWHRVVLEALRRGETEAQVPSS